jgi:hypothetical protein
MRIIAGRICGLLNNRAGEINGIILDGGESVRFPPERASGVLLIATLGSQVEVQALVQNGLTANNQFLGIAITNLASKQSAKLAVAPSNKPEVSAEIYPPPGTVTPLAPTLQELCARSSQDAGQPAATRRDVADEMEQAYDGLHRTQAMLAYLIMIKQEKSQIGMYLDEAKHTYVQALTRYQARDFEGAREFAAASSSLSKAIEILISRTFHSSSDYPKLAPLPPERIPGRADPGATQRELDRIEHLLARIDWVTDNGTLPTEDREQVRKLAQWSANLRRWALRLADTGAVEEAVEFVRAAEAAASSAEHLCKKCYVTRSADSQIAARLH